MKKIKLDIVFVLYGMVLMGINIFVCTGNIFSFIGLVGGISLVITGLYAIVTKIFFNDG